jgi:hypothetical protein
VRKDFKMKADILCFIKNIIVSEYIVETSLNRKRCKIIKSMLAKKHLIQEKI